MTVLSVLVYSTTLYLKRTHSFTQKLKSYERGLRLSTSVLSSLAHKELPFSKRLMYVLYIIKYHYREDRT